MTNVNRPHSGAHACILTWVGPIDLFMLFRYINIHVLSVLPILNKKDEIQSVVVGEGAMLSCDDIQPLPASSVKVRWRKRKQGRETSIKSDGRVLVPAANSEDLTKSI